MKARGQAERLGPEDFLDQPFDSQSTHQFLEKARVFQAYRRLLALEGEVEVFAGAYSAYLSPERDPAKKRLLEELIEESEQALGQLISGELNSVRNAVFVSGSRLITVDRLWYAKQGELRLDVCSGATKLKDSAVRQAGWTLQALEQRGIVPSSVYVLLLNRKFFAADNSSLQHQPTSLFVEQRQKRGQKFMKQNMDVAATDILSSFERAGSIEDIPPCHGGRCNLCSGSDEKVRPEDWGSIHQLHKSGGLAGKLAQQGILWIDELDQVKAPLRQKLTAQHWIQYHAEKSGEEQIDAPALKRFLDGLQWPLYFLDFECFLEALPSWQNVSVWEHTPFLYSLYKMDRNGELSRMEHMLIEAPEDQRQQMCAKLVNDLGECGSVLVYGIHFERAVLQRLSMQFPQYGQGLGNIIGRLVDAQKPFADFSYYHPQQGGKISLKTILPILTEAQYDSKSVSNGSEAFIGYYYLLHPDLPVKPQWDTYAEEVRSDPQRFYRQVVEYCDTDTYGLAFLIRFLQQKIPPS